MKLIISNKDRELLSHFIHLPYVRAIIDTINSIKWADQNVLCMMFYIDEIEELTDEYCVCLEMSMVPLTMSNRKCGKITKLICQVTNEDNYSDEDGLLIFDWYFQNPNKKSFHLSNMKMDIIKSVWAEQDNPSRKYIPKETMFRII